MTRTEKGTVYEVVICYRTASTGVGSANRWLVRDNIGSRALAEDLAKAALPVFVAHFHEEYSWFGPLLEAEAEVIERTAGRQSVCVVTADLPPRPDARVESLEAPVAQQADLQAPPA